MEKHFIDLIASASAKVEGVNAAWKKAIAYAVNKAYGANDTTYAQYALDAAVKGVRPGVASAFRKLGLVISRLEHGQYKAESVRSMKAKREVLERVKAGDIPDVVAMADPLPKVKKERSEAEKLAAANDDAQKAIERMLARLKAENPAAFAIANERVTRSTPVEVPVERVVEKFSPNVICIGDNEDILDCTPDEIFAAVEAVNALRRGQLKAAA